MKILWHIVRHDLRALRLPLLAWLVVLLVQGVMMAAGPGLLDAEGPRGLAVGFAEFLAGARLALTILLTVMLVQRDSPVGTTAFWLTRPIAPVTLAAGKLCSATLLIVVLPAAVGWALFSALGLPPGGVRDGIWQLILEQALLVSLSAMGAAITASVAQFAVVAAAAVLLFGALMSRAAPFLERLAVVRMPADWSPTAAWTLVTVVGAVAVVAFQYSRRRTVLAAVAATSVLVLGVMSMQTARAAFTTGPIPPLRPGMLDPGAVTLSLDPTALRVASGGTYDRKGRLIRYRYASAILRTAGAPPAVVLQPGPIDSTWRPEGASPASWQGRRPASRIDVQRDSEADGQPFRSIALCLGDVELLKPVRSEGTAFRTTLLSLPEERVSRLSPAQGPLDAVVTLRAWRYRVVESAPLAMRGSLAARDGRLTVRGIARNREGVHVDVDWVFLQRVWWTAEDELGSGGIGSAERLVLRNRPRKQAILLASDSLRQFGYSFLGGMSGVQLGTGVRRLRFVVPLDDEHRLTLDEEWLAGAELVVMRPEDLGAFTKPLRVEWVNLEGVK